MRLDKFLGLQGYTRGEARALLRAGRVSVDGVAVRDAAFALDVQTARVRLDGEVLLYSESLHLMLRKPAGVLTAASDSRHDTVMDLLPKYVRAQGCMPIGRLDIDTEGLLLFTTDGRLGHRLLSPKRQVDKLYEAVVDAPLDASDVEAFAAGVTLSDFVALPAQLELLDTYRARVTLCEGKFHQVKRMFAARGKQVTFLQRLCFGGVWLDPALLPGQWRTLSKSELETLYTAAGSRQIKTE